MHFNSRIMLESFKTALSAALLEALSVVFSAFFLQKPGNEKTAGDKEAKSKIERNSKVLCKIQSDFFYIVDRLFYQMPTLPRNPKFGRPDFDVPHPRTSK